MKTETSDPANFFSDHVAIFFSLFLGNTPGTFAVSTAKKKWPSHCNAIVFFWPVFWFGLKLPNLIDFAFLNIFQTFASTCPGSHLAWKLTNLIEVARSKSTWRLVLYNSLSFLKPSKHLTLISFLRPPGLKNSLTLTPCPGTWSSKYLDCISLDLKYSVPAIKMTLGTPDTLFCALQQRAQLFCDVQHSYGTTRSTGGGILV